MLDRTNDTEMVSGMLTERLYQTEAVDALFDFFYTNVGNPLIAMPTGTGKSIVIAKFVHRAMQMYPNTRVLILTHVKELIEQNADKLLRVWPHAPMGIFSAGLGQRDTIHPIIFGGVASVVNCVGMFGHRDLLIIDEAHLLGPNANTMYQKIIGQLRATNPALKIIGLTATWYRLKQGRLTDATDEGPALFTHMPFNLCGVEGFNRLISEGFLVPPIPKRTRTMLDTSEVGTQNGEFIQSQLQKAVDRPDVTYAALYEACEHGYDRKSWLVFCSGIEHAEHCAETLQAFGIKAAAVHSKMAPSLRDERIRAFKAGHLQAVTNNNILTTGFDHPPIDFIPMLRPTLSPGLWVQMLGRGTRPAEDKANCLVLDFAGNTARLGPINDPVIPRQKGKGNGEVPVKICDVCGTYNHARVKFCISCGTEFTFREKIARTASTQELIRGGMPITEWFNIDRLMYQRHMGKESGKASIKVSYMCGLRLFHEYVCFDHTGYARHRANEWWRQRHPGEPPLSTDLALTHLAECRTPRRIKVWINKKNPEVLSHEY